MDLFDAEAGGKWHPITSMIQVGPRQTEGDVIYAAVVEYSKDHLYSTLMHESVHLSSARTTRFGWLMSREATRAWGDWRRGAPATIAEPVEKMLAALVPLLEGLATYGQLDFDGEPGIPVPFSLTQVVHLCAITEMECHTRRKFRIIRKAADWSRYPDTLLDLLLLNNTDEQNNYYFSGYLYLKAVQASWTSRCQAFSDPAFFLPVAIRFVCDHPVFAKAGADLTAQDILGEVHSSLTSVTAAQLTLLATMLRDKPEFQRRFDNWDLYRQLGEAGDTMVTHGEGSLRPFFDLSSPDASTLVAQRFRSAASVYLPHWAHGRLLGVAEDHVEIGDSGKTLRVSVPPYRNLWMRQWSLEREQAANDAERNRLDEVARAVLEGELAFRKRLAESVGNVVTIAMFFTMTRGTPGVALWDEREKPSWYPFGYSDFMGDGHNEPMVIGLGLDMCPTDRDSFGRQFTFSDGAKRQRLSAHEYLLEQLVSNSRNRMLLRQRLSGILGEELPALRAWARPDLFGRAAPLPAEALAKADLIFDFPGFPEPHKPRFADLLPVPNME